MRSTLLRINNLDIEVDLLTISRGKSIFPLLIPCLFSSTLPVLICPAYRGRCRFRAYVSVLAGGGGVVSKLDRLTDQSKIH